MNRISWRSPDSARTKVVAALLASVAVTAALGPSAADAQAPAVAADAAGAGQAQGGDQSNADAAAMGDIVVTAQRRETRLQDTPIAITAVTSDLAEKAHVEAARDLSKITPGLIFAAVSGLETPVTLRGIASSGLGLGGDSPTAIYLDGVYLAQPHSATFALADIDRIEVLRGPQGTLYGQNSTAGAIKIITITPGNETKGSFSAEVGSYDLMGFKGTVSGPIVDDTLYAKFSGTHREKNGFYRNFYTGKTAGDTSETTVSGALRWTPSSAADLILRGDWSKSSIPPVRQLIFSTVATDTPPVPCQPPHCDLTFTNGQPDPTQKFENWGVSLTGKLDLGFAALTSITAYRHQHWFYIIDNSALAASLFPVQNVQDESQLSQEINLTSQGSGPLQWVLGAFYLHEKGDAFVPLMFVNTLLIPDVNRDGIADNLQPTTWSSLKQDAIALFGEATYQVTDKLKFTAGLRYGHSEKKLLKDSLTRILVSPQPPLIGSFQGIPPRSAAPLANRRDLSASWDYFIPRAIAAYEFSNHVMAYASVSRGFKNGGFDFASTNPGPFNPEKLWTYEAGLKADFLDRRVRTNIAVYRSDYKGLQLTIQDALGNRVTTNAGDSRIYGAELEYAIRPTNALTIDGFVTYTSAKFKDFTYDVSRFGLSPAANCVGGQVVNVGFCDLSGNHVPRTPKWTFAINGQYEIPLGSAGTLTPRVSFNYQSKGFYTIQNIAPASFDHVESLDARVTYDAPDGHWSLSVYAENLTNYRYIAGAGDANISRSANPLNPLPQGARRVIGNPNAPRTFGAVLKYRL